MRVVNHNSRFGGLGPYECPSIDWLVEQVRRGVGVPFAELAWLGSVDYPKQVSESREMYVARVSASVAAEFRNGLQVERVDIDGNS